MKNNASKSTKKVVAERATVTHVSKADVKLTALGTKYNNFNVINNANKAPAVAHLQKLNEAQQASYAKFFAAIKKAVKLDINTDKRSYVNIFAQSKSGEALNIQFDCSGERFRIYITVNKKHVNKLAKHMQAVDKQAKVDWGNYVKFYGYTVLHVAQTCELVLHAINFDSNIK